MAAGRSLSNSSAVIGSLLETTMDRSSEPETAPANRAGTAPEPHAPAPGLAAVGDDATVARRSGPLGLPRAYWLLWGGMLFNRLGGSVFFLLAIYLTRERGFSLGLAGLAVSLYAAGGTVSGPVGGVLADRAGRRATLLLGTACAGTLMLALGAARAPAAILTLAPLLGFFTDLCRAPLQAAVADLVPPAGRQRAYGLLYWAINLGFAGAASLGGLLAEHNFQLLFVIDALTTYGYGLVVLTGVPETRPPLLRERASVSGARAFILPLRDRPFVSFMAIQLLLLLAFVQVIVALPLDMRAHGLGTAQIGWLLALNGVFIVIMQPIALRFLRLTSVQWLAAGSVLTGLGLGTTALAGAGTDVYILAIVLWTLGEIGFSIAAPTLIAHFSPVAQRGAYMGAYQLAWGAASLSGPALGSLVLGHLGGRALWIGSLVACLAAGALHLTVTARRARA